MIPARPPARRVTPRTRAVMCVDWGGAICDVPELGDASGVPVIEDAAHAFGAARAGVSPAAACWSFQAIKHLTTGDGGALFVRDAQARERARLLRWFGIDRQAPGPNIDKPIAEAGHKYHMNDVAAAIGVANLPLAVAAVERHRANAAWYGDALRDVAGIRLPPADPGSAWWLYTLILEPEDAQRGFTEFMAARGVECSRVHARNDVHRAFGAGPADLPGVSYFDGHQIAIPVGWWVGDETRERIAEAVRAWARGNA
jgi:dTDP-4-amino-4,6-dideoxygalactose transaminase